MTEHPLLNSIVGERLSSIEFVQDYLQLRFDGPTLTVYTHPSVTFDSVTYPWENPAFCNVLRGRIGVHVVAARVNLPDAISLTFADQTVVRIPLQEAGFAGPEAALFMDPLTHEWDVWRIGDG